MVIFMGGNLCDKVATSNFHDVSGVPPSWAIFGSGKLDYCDLNIPVSSNL